MVCEYFFKIYSAYLDLVYNINYLMLIRLFTDTAISDYICLHLYVAISIRQFTFGINFSDLQNSYPRDTDSD